MSLAYEWCVQIIVSFIVTTLDILKISYVSICLTIILHLAPLQEKGQYLF